MINENKKILALILGGALIISSMIFGIFYYKAQISSGKDVLAVTGSAKTRVTSDQAKMVLYISHITSSTNLSGGYEAVSRDEKAVLNFLKNNGIANEDISDMPVSANQVYDQNYSAGSRFDINKTITVQSNDVAKLTEISKKISTLISDGAMVSIQSLQYYYSKLPDLRVSLLEEAVKDAKLRAENIAKGTGRGVGGIRSASSGVVQVLSPNSVDISDYGNYDTSSIEKDVMVTVKASFDLK